MERQLKKLEKPMGKFFRSCWTAVTQWLDSDYQAGHPDDFKDTPDRVEWIASLPH